MKPLTGPQINAMRALRDLCDTPRPNGQPTGHAAPRAVAKALWPDSPAWQKRTRRYGANRNGAVGGTMPMKAATLLWRLADRGYADPPPLGENGWTITAAGRAALAP